MGRMNHREQEMHDLGVALTKFLESIPFDPDEQNLRTIEKVEWLLNGIREASIAMSPQACNLVSVHQRLKSRFQAIPF